VEILERIATRPSSARQIAEMTGEPLCQIAYHTSVLYEAGCIVPLDPAQPDPGERIYEIASLDSAPPRLSLSEHNRSRALSSILRKIVDNGRAALAAGVLDSENSRLSCHSILLDEQGLREARAILDEAAERIEAARAATAKRLVRDRGKGVRATIAFAAFESPQDEKNPRT